MPAFQRLGWAKVALLGPALICDAPQIEAALTQRNPIRNICDRKVFGR